MPLDLLISPQNLFVKPGIRKHIYHLRRLTVQIGQTISGHTTLTVMGISFTIVGGRKHSFGEHRLLLWLTTQAQWYQY